MPCAGAKKRDTKSTPLSPGACYGSPAIDFGERRHIGFQRGDFGRHAIDHETIASAQHRLRRAAERREQPGRRARLLGGRDGKSISKSSEPRLATRSVPV